jgi:hypothetical protein
MREAGAVFNAAEQECISVLQQRRACVEDTVDWIRPVLSSQNWILAVSSKKRRF